MSEFRRVLFIALTSGALAGCLWFALQYMTLLPLIAAAERYEAAHQGAHDAAHEEDHHESCLL
jgi:predicted cobalt transporter CbtA